MKYVTLFTAVVMLAGCSSVEERQANVMDLLQQAEQTASGTVNDGMKDLEGIIQQGKTITEGVNDMVDDAKKRMNQVKEGVDMMLDGKEMIEGGIKGE